MKFWDSSAIVPLLVPEVTSTRLQALGDSDPDMLVWWGTRIECTSALARRGHEGTLDARRAARAIDRLQQFFSTWGEIEPSDRVRETAARFLRVHPLRAADALQIAAAFIGAEGRPAAFEFVTLDERLATAARKEGFIVLDGGGTGG